MFSLFFTAAGTGAASFLRQIPHGGIFLTHERARGLPRLLQKLFRAGGGARNSRASALARARTCACART